MYAYRHTSSELNLSPPHNPLCNVIIIIVNPNCLRPYHTTFGPAAGPTCSKILAPPLITPVPIVDTYALSDLIKLAVAVADVDRFCCNLVTCLQFNLTVLM